MKILLIGIGGVYNYGCEAIVRGTVAMLRKQIPQVTILYASIDFERDCKALADLDIWVVNVRAKKYTIRWFLERIRRRLGFKRKFGFWSPGLIPDCDITLSIGGDIYTIDANTSPDGYFHPLVEIGEYLISKGVKYVLWGASVGPFLKYPQIETYYHNHLKKCALITVREELTEAYLKQLGDVKAVRVADPAFWMSAGRSNLVDLPEARGIRIGLNLSRLSVRQRYPKSDWERQESRIVDFLKNLAMTNGAEIVLIPHVQPGNGSPDDDYTFLTEVKNRAAAKNIQLLPPCLGAPNTKAVIAECDILIAARMHCAIAGVSMGIPTVFLSYSPKALGMAEYVYGHQRFSFDLDQVSEPSLMLAIEEIIQTKNEISTFLKSHLQQWQTAAMTAVSALRKGL